jgi:hypothetical protein
VVCKKEKMKDKIDWFGKGGKDTTEFFKDVGKGVGAVISLVVVGALLGTAIKMFGGGK